MGRMNEMFGQVKVECWVERRGGGGMNGRE